MARWAEADGAILSLGSVWIDPYARDVFFPPSYDREAARRPGSNAG